MKAMALTALVCCLLMPAYPLHAYDFDFVTVTDIVKKVKKRFGEVDSYQANFVVNSVKLGKRTTQTGVVRYKAANKMIIDFNSPKQHKVVSNGKTMWIYIPSMNVVAEQTLKSDSGSIFSSGTKSGLRRLFSKYHYRFDSKDQPVIQPDGSKNYVLMLKQKESRGGFRTLKLWIGEDFFIRKAFGQTATGKDIDIEFSGIRTDVSFQNSLFKFDIPSGARVVQNPMIAEE
jgi:outer membrane lipoprotein-sorting protein